MAPPAALSIENVAVHFGGLVALSDMTFTVGEGEIVSLIGPNGAGKTTAFNVMTGFLNATHGAVSYHGKSLNGLKPHQIADLGLIRTFQRTSVFPNDTVHDNLLIGLHRQGRHGFALAADQLRRERWRHDRRGAPRSNHDSVSRGSRDDRAGAHVRAPLARTSPS